jgi:hypothetical protein
MKFIVKLQTAENLDTQIEKAVIEELEPTKTEQERVLLIDHRVDATYDIIKRWFNAYGILTVEIDTEQESIRVVQS